MKKTYLIFALFIGLVAFTACSSKNDDVNVGLESDENLSTLTSGDYKINTDESQMKWHGYRLVGNSHTGLIAIQDGSLQVAEGKLVGGEFAIDMNSLKSDEGIEGLESHLKGEDFFDVAQYPEAKLLINEATLLDEAGNYNIQADLTIKDITAPIDFMAKIYQNGDVLKAETDFSIDRTTWNLKYGSGKFFQDLGDKVISDDIDFRIDLTANLMN